MGLVHAEIELINGFDLEMARRHSIGEEEIRRINISVLVDTGCITLAINENIQEILQLPVIGKRRAELADGKWVLCDEVDLVKIKFRDRETICQALVLPGNSEPLLGVIPLEGMDLVINAQRQEVTVNPEHPEFPVYCMKTAKRRGRVQMLSKDL